MKTFGYKNKESGQALLLVLLAMSVVLTVALSIVSRSVTDISTSTNEADSARAFAAAQAGVERALVANTTTNGTFTNNSTYNSVVSSTGSNLLTYNYPTALSSGDSATIWFVSHDASGNPTCSGNTCFAGNYITVCWGNSNAAPAPAMEATVYFETTPGNATTMQIAKVNVDPSARGNGFDVPDAGTCSLNGTTYQYKKKITFSSNVNGTVHIGGAYTNQNGLQFVRVKLLYNTSVGHNVGIDVTGGTGNGNGLPAQGFSVTSTGTSGNANRRLNVYQTYPDPPSVFDAAVYTNGALVK